MLTLENAAVTAVNLSTVQDTATVTLTFSNPSDTTLAALLAMANQPVVGTLTASPT